MATKRPTRSSSKPKAATRQPSRLENLAARKHSFDETSEEQLVDHSGVFRVTSAISQAQTMSVAVKASESRIRDANIAEESANLTRFSILNQSGIAALAQANASTGSVLALLG